MVRRLAVTAAMAERLETASDNRVEARFGENIVRLVAIESEILRVMEKVYSG